MSSNTAGSAVVVGLPSRIPTAPLDRPCRPPRVSDYSDYRDCLRRGFNFICVYCGSSEMEVGPLLKYGGFEVEHFRPEAQFEHLAKVFANLLWACRACNSAKSNTWPTAEEVKLGRRFADPCKEPLSKHLAEDGVTLKALTSVGAYMIEMIDLDSHLHQERRRRRGEKFLLCEQIAAELAVAEANGDERITSILKSSLKELLPTEPWDAPPDCICSRKRQ